MQLHTNIVIKNCSNKHSKVAHLHNFILMRTGQQNYDVWSLDAFAPVKHTSKDLIAVVKALHAI